MLWRDIVHGARVFARNPGLTAIAIVSIALGTGANVAIFSAADTLLLRPLPVAEPDELVTVGSRVQNGPRGVVRNAASYLDFLDIRSRVTTLSGLAAYTYEDVGFATGPTAAPRVRIASFISDGFFKVLGVELQYGREFRADEAGAADPRPVVIIGDALWRSDFAADPNVVGRTMRIGGREFVIVGVAPARFTGLHSFVREVLFLPLGLLPQAVSLWRPDVLQARDLRRFTLKGRMRPDVTLSEVRTELEAIGLDLERAYPITNKNQTVVAQTEFEYKFQQRPMDASIIVLLTILAVGVLCVSCANVAGLLASRGPVRAREMALRLAVGASRARLVRQLLTESLCIAIVGAAGGLLVARIGIALLRQIQFSSEIVSPPAFELDERALFFSIAVAMVTTLLVGFGPALQTTRVDLVTSLKAVDGISRIRQRLKGRTVLVMAQVALSLGLLTIAVLAVQIFQRELVAGPGFRTTQVAKVTVDAGQAGYDRNEAAGFFSRVLEDIRQLPGVRSASVTSAMPMFSYQFTTIAIEGELSAADEPNVFIWANSVDDRYFDTLDIQLLAGRRFTGADTFGAPRVAIVNDTLARRWPGRNPVGQRVQLIENQSSWLLVVGVVETTKVGFPGEVPQEAIYFPYLQRPRGQMVVLAHAAGDSADMVEPLRAAVLALDKNVPVFDAQTIETFYDAHATSYLRIGARLIGGMGLMGLGLTMVGLYGLVSYAVARRTREIGIRIAIGATYAGIVRMVLRQGMVPVWGGLAAGAVLSLMAGRLLRAIVPFVDHPESHPYYIVVFFVLTMTLAAAFVPARRAAKTNPTVALRCD